MSTRKSRESRELKKEKSSASAEAPLSSGTNAAAANSEKAEDAPKTRPSKRTEKAPKDAGTTRFFLKLKNKKKTVIGPDDLEDDAAPSSPTLDPSDSASSITSTSSSISTDIAMDEPKDDEAVPVRIADDSASEKGEYYQLERQESLTEVLNLFQAFKERKRNDSTLRERKRKDREIMKNEIKEEIKAEIKEEIKKEIQVEVERELSRRSSSQRGFTMAVHRSTSFTQVTTPPAGLELEQATPEPQEALPVMSPPRAQIIVVDEEEDNNLDRKEVDQDKGVDEPDNLDKAEVKQDIESVPVVEDKPSLAIVEKEEVVLFVEPTPAPVLSPVEEPQKEIPTPAPNLVPAAAPMASRSGPRADVSSMDNESAARRRILLERKESTPNFARGKSAKPSLTGPLSATDRASELSRAKEELMRRPTKPSDAKDLKKQQFATLKRPPRKAPASMSATLSMIDLPSAAVKSKDGKIKVKDVRTGEFTSIQEMEASAHSRWEEFMKEIQVKKEKAKQHKLQFDAEQEKKIKSDAEKIIGALKARAPEPSSVPPPPPPPPRMSQPPPVVNIFKFGSDTDFADLFGEVEESPGTVQIWSIEAFRPQRIAVDEHGGTFYTKNAYLVLHTSEKDSALVYTMHLWMGADARADKRGSCAMLGCQLATHVHGASHHREEQGSESPAFHKYFMEYGGIKHEDGGCEPDFAHIDPENPHNIPTVMYSITKHGDSALMLVKRVKVASESLRDDAVVVLLTRDAIYQWNGKEAPLKAKIKARTFTKELKVFHGNMAMRSVEMAFDHTSKEFMDTIERYEREHKEEEEEEDQEEDEDIDDQTANLLKVSETSVGGKLDLVTVQEGFPLKYAHMKDPEDVIILDCITDIFVWFGTKSSKRKKAAGLECAKLFFQNYYRPPWATIRRVRPGSEHPFFKAYFSDWPRKDPVPVFQKPVKKEAPKLATFLPDAEPVYSTPDRVVSHDRAKYLGGSVEMWALKKNGQPSHRLAPAERGQFYSKENTLILYTKHPDDDKEDPICEIYFWQGHAADQKVFASFMFGFVPVLSTKLRAGGFNPPTPSQVFEHKEDRHLIELFGGSIVIHQGARPTDATVQPLSTCLYDLRETSVHGDPTSAYYHLVQVHSDVSRLDSRDVFVLRSPANKIALWIGKLSSAASRGKVIDIACRTFPHVNVNDIATVNEGEEPDEFWEGAFGVKKSWTSPDDPSIPYRATSPTSVAQFKRSPRMFRCSNNTGKFEVELISPYWVTDLLPESALILDTGGDDVYLWTGDDARGSLSALASMFAIEYAKVAQHHRSQPVRVTTFESEPKKLPAEFKRHFHAWPWSG